MATDEGMMESDEYQDWIDVYGEEGEEVELTTPTAPKGDTNE